ncbi:MAG: acetyl-CoA carboxylase biotin carboxyl carrier protein [Oscillospiraceae bacterium]
MAIEKKPIGNGLDLGDVEEIAKLMKKNKLSRIEIENKGFKLVVEGERPQQAPAFLPPQGFAAQAAPAAEQTAGSAASTPSAPAVCGQVIAAPIVGTYYSAPSPDSEPFVKVGARVKKGEVIFIIESMKVMSEVQSEFSGTVKEICVKNGDAVEFGQKILILE